MFVLNKQLYRHQDGGSLRPNQNNEIQPGQEGLLFLAELIDLLFVYLGIWPT